jgi:hypothetical protein
MRGERLLRAVEDADPIWRLWAQLPPEWRGPVIGDGIDNWLDISENDGNRLILTGLPDVIAAEMAWMAHWQVQDGTRASVLALNQLAHILRRAIQERHTFPSSIRLMEWPTAEALQGWYYTKRCWPGATPGTGGSWTSGILGATHESRCRNESRWATTAAPRA